MRVKFDNVFKINDDGTITPKAFIKIGMVTLSDNAPLAPGAKIGDFDIHQYKNYDFELTQCSDGTRELLLIYDDQQKQDSLNKMQ